MPLPIPRWLINSPSHISIVVPATSDGITINARGMNGSSNTTSGTVAAAPKNAEPLP